MSWRPRPSGCFQQSPQHDQVAFELTRRERSLAAVSAAGVAGVGTATLRSINLRFPRYSLGHSASATATAGENERVILSS